MKFAPRKGQMLPDFSTEINKQLQIKERLNCGLLLAELEG
jgi:hypothetical protein